VTANGCGFSVTRRAPSSASTCTTGAWTTNLNFSSLGGPRFNRTMGAASKLSGDERYAAYAQLDHDLMRDAAPWATYASPNVRELVSSRMTNDVST